MSSINDLVEILENQNYSPLEIIEMLNDFNKEDLEDYAVDNKVCYKCFSQLTIHTWKEPSEHFGSYVEEEVLEYQCEGCGYTY